MLLSRPGAVAGAHAAAWAGATAFAIGAAGLLGWVLHWDVLTRIIGGWATMKVNSAVALCALGAAVCAWRAGRGISDGLATLAAGLALVALTEWVLGRDLGLDQLVVLDPESLSLGEPPGRMAVATAVGILLVAASVWIARWERHASTSQAVGALASSVGWVALLGYAYELGPLTSVWMYGTVSAPTAACLAAAGTGAALLRPREGWVARLFADDVGGQVLRRLGPAALAVPAMSAFGALHVHRALDVQTGFTLGVAATINGVTFLALLARTAQDARREEFARREATDALGLAHVQLLQVSRERLLDQERERRHLAHELHDELGQGLVAIGLTLARELPANSDLRELVGALSESVRGLALDLRPPMLDELGLEPTLRWYLPRWSGQTGIDAQLHAAAWQARLGPELEIAAFRIVQEALTNTARHSGARAVRVSLAVEDDALGIEVHDDGVGVAPRRAGPEGLGLLGMRERAVAAGGTLTLDSTAGGATLRATLPLPPRRSR